jgi:hypothetical protein
LASQGRPAKGQSGQEANALGHRIVDALLGGTAKAQGRLHLQVAVHMEAR